MMQARFLITLFLLGSLFTKAFAQAGATADERAGIDETPSTVSVVQLEEAGILSTGMKEFELEYPNCLVGKYGNVYVYDAATGRGLLFDGAGKYLTTLFQEKVKATRKKAFMGYHYRYYPFPFSIDTDITGRILMCDADVLYLVDGEMKKLENRHRSYRASLGNGKIYAVERKVSETYEEVFLRELSIHGRLLRVIERLEYPSNYAVPWDYAYISVFEDRLFFIGRRPINILVFDLENNRRNNIEFDIETWMKRVGWQWPEYEINGKMVRIRMIPIVQAGEVHGGEIYLLIKRSTTKGWDCQITVLDLSGNIIRAYEIPIPERTSVGGMAVGKSGDDIRFFLLVNRWKDQKPNSRSIVMFTPAPTDEMHSPRSRR